MRRFAIRLLSPTICAMALAALVAPIEAEASGRHVHVHKHHRMSHGFANFQDPREMRPAAPSWGATGDVCPGSGRSFDCKVWPPPFDQDPDRKAPGADAGG